MDLKKVTLPLSPENMVEFFKDKDQVYEINVSDTLADMTERAMMMYISNLGLKCAFDHVSSTMMEEYMVMKNFLESPMLTAIHANIIYFLKYQEIPYTIALEDFDIEAIIKFIDEHEDLVIEQAVFLDSFLLYITTCKEGEVIPVGQPVDTELHDELGFSIIKLLNHEDFMIVFSKTIPPLDEQTYYTQYFDEYMFKGKNLFYYANTSPMFGMIKAIQDGQIK